MDLFIIFDSGFSCAAFFLVVLYFLYDGCGLRQPRAYGSMPEPGPFPLLVHGEGKS